MKRFTETTKWRDTWFMDLPAKWKLAWLWLLDNCDNAGVCEANPRLMSFEIGEPLDGDEMLRMMAGRVSKPKPGKWYIERFIEYQYGELRDSCQYHQRVKETLRKHGLSGELFPVDSPSQSPSHPPSQSPSPEDKDKETDKVSEKDTQVEVVWAAYPKKVGKREALPVIRAIIRERGFDFILERVKAYAAAVAQWPTEDRCYIPDPVRWFRRGRYDDDTTAWERKLPVGNNRVGRVTEEDHRHGF